MISVWSPESPIHGPGEYAGDQKDDHEHEVNAFDLLFVDCVQYMVNGWPLTKDADDIAGFKQSDPDEPKDHEDPASHGDAFSVFVGHSQMVNRKS
jgi:hypothetical protein